jgi:hypothetical protein
MQNMRLQITTAKLFKDQQLCLNFNGHQTERRFEQET